jgi:hypothetical protein
MNRSILIAFAAAALVFSTPAFAQRSHPSPGGQPAGVGGAGPTHGSDMSGSHETGAVANRDMPHASPGAVLFARMRHGSSLRLISHKSSFLLPHSHVSLTSMSCTIKVS